MAKLINIIDLKEIKALRVSCKNCHAYWSVLVAPGEIKLPKKCFACNTVIPNNHFEYIKGLLQNIVSIHEYLKEFQISIELEVKEK